MQKLGGQVANTLRPRRSEHDGHPLAVRHRDDGTHVLLKPHVEHPVRLVEHEVRRAVQHTRALVHQIEQPARRRHQHLHARAERAALRAFGDAAVDAHARQPHVRPRVAAHRVRLHRQLSRGREHKHARLAARTVRRRRGAVHHRGEEEGERLAGARLRHADDVAARHDHRPARRLDRRGLVEGGAGAQHRRRESRVGEGSDGAEGGGAHARHLDAVLLAELGRRGGRHHQHRRGRQPGGRRIGAFRLLRRRRRLLAAFPLR
mmetsp:Transcript_28967/g.72245  ORF Transcript_28967/g.72245 Transcript_28967/m.72245 type:complete len:262 (-) Transcript_28967:326-1111(-)